METQFRERRMKAFRLNAHCLARVLAQGESIKVIEAWPEDAVLIRAYFDHEYEDFVMVFEHPSFPLMIEGASQLRAWLTIETLPKVESVEPQAEGKI